MGAWIETAITPVVREIIGTLLYGSAKNMEGE